MNKSISNFFYPDSICVAGASTKEHSLGFEVLKNIKKFNFKGKVFPVNPGAKSIHGYRCYSSILNIDDEIDLAIVLVPKRFVVDTIEELIEKGVKSIILITAGFKETGLKGENLQNSILEKIKNAHARLVGPNCMGVISATDASLNGTFISEMPLKGKIAFLSQSGALGAIILNTLRESNLRMAHFISVGNKADINENDLLQYWQEDNNIDILTFYLESFKNGFEFIKPFFLNKISKPAIVLKAGNTKSGMRAASSHTGALGSEDRFADSLLKQAGIIRVETVTELFNTAKGLESYPIPKGNRVAVVTNAGGPSILLTDKLDKEGLQLANLSEDTIAKLKTVVHPEGSVNNPVDLLPLGNKDTFAAAIKILVSDKNVDSVVSLFVDPSMIEPISVATKVNNVKSEKPIMQVIMPKPEFWEEYRSLPEPRKPIFRNPEEPATILSNMLFYAKQKSFNEKNIDEIKSLFALPTLTKFNYPEGYLSTQQIREITEYYNFPLVKEIVVDANSANFENIDFFPVVIKGISKEVIHKSEFDAVKLNIKDRDELLSVSDEIRNNFIRNGFSVESFLIQSFVSTKHELLLGGFNDESFGPIIMFGSGGKYVEVFNDTAIRSAYISRPGIMEMISSTKIGKILFGVRGEKGINFAPLVEIIHSASKMIIENPRIKEFDFNPLIVDVNNAIHAVDIRIKFGEHL